MTIDEALDLLRLLIQEGKSCLLITWPDRSLSLTNLGNVDALAGWAAPLAEAARPDQGPAPTTHGSPLTAHSSSDSWYSCDMYCPGCTHRFHAETTDVNHHMVCPHCFREDTYVTLARPIS